jgi:hypothetical protein
MVAPTISPVRDGLRLYRVGSFGALLGEPAPAGATCVGARYHGALDEPDLFAHVDPTAREIPWGDVRGTVEDVEPGVSLVVGINGVLAGTAETHSDPSGGDVRWWSRVPPWMFRPGANDVALFVVSGTADAPSYERVDLG